jgi:hypothetical protein
MRMKMKIARGDMSVGAHFKLLSKALVSCNLSSLWILHLAGLNRGRIAGVHLTKGHK